MSESARVTSIDELSDFRAAMCRFREEAAEALAAIDMEIRRTDDWLHDQLNFWQQAVRQCEDDLVQAKAALWRKQTPNALGRIPDCYEEIKAVQRAKARLEHAENQVKVCRSWRPKWQHAVTEYHGPAKRLAGYLDGGLQQAVGLLEQKIASLEAYVNMTAPPPPRENP